MTEATIDTILLSAISCLLALQLSMVRSWTNKIVERIDHFEKRFDAVEKHEVECESKFVKAADNTNDHRRLWAETEKQKEEIGTIQNKIQKHDVILDILQKK